MPPLLATSKKLNRRQTAFQPADASSPNALPPSDSSLVAASQPQAAGDSASINTIIALTVVFGLVFVAFALFVIYWLYMRRLIQLERDRADAEDTVWPGHRRYSRENGLRGRTGGSLSAGSADSRSDGPKPNPPLRMPSSSESSEEEVTYSGHVEDSGGYSAPGNCGTRGYHPPFTTPHYPKTRKHQQTRYLSPLSSFSYPAEFEASFPSRRSKPPRRGPSSRAKPRRSPGEKTTGRKSMMYESPRRQSEDERASSNRSHSRPSNAPPCPRPYPPPPEVETVDGTVEGT